MGTTRGLLRLTICMTDANILQTISLSWEFIIMYYVGENNYVLCRRMRDRAENPTVGVGVVHQALAAPHTARGLLRFTICMTDANILQTISLSWEFIIMYYVGEKKYVLCRRMRDRAENPAVGVGVVDQALAAPHTARGLLRFTICVTDGPFVMDGERLSLAQ